MEPGLGLVKGALISKELTYSMSKFIDLVETFDFTALHPDSYAEKIDGLLERFPKYENDDNFRTVLPSNFAKTADDYISMKFCTIGRFPVYGIYDRRDLDLVAVCVERIMYALDDCDLHGSFVPDLEVRKVHLGIQYTPLATRETLNYLRNCLCSAISTISLGYTPEKKNEWCEAIVLLTGMTSQAVRFHEMKEHVQFGLYFGLPYDTTTSNGRYELSCGDIAMQYRWNKISKAIRRGEYPYVFSHYADRGTYSTHAMCEYSARDDVSLINDKDKTKAGKCRKRINKWNGPLENSKRNREEESHRRSFLEREMVRKQLMDKKLSERMHGAWYGTLKYEVASVNCLPTPAQMVRANRFLVSATPPLDCLQGLLHVQTSVASIYLAAKSIRIEGGLLTYFRDTRLFVQLRSGRIFGAPEETCVPSLQAITTRMHTRNSNANVGHTGISHIFKRNCQHGDLTGFCKGIFGKLLNVVPSAKAARKLDAAILVTNMKAKGSLIKKYAKF